MKEWAGQWESFGRMEPGFERLDHIRDPGGVFVLCLRGKIVYVGQSNSLYNRAAQLALRMKRPFPRSYSGHDFRGTPLFFDEVWVKFCPETEAAKLKIDLIAKHKPEQQPPMRLNHGEFRPDHSRRVDLWALAKAAGVKLERVEKDRRRVR